MPLPRLSIDRDVFRHAPAVLEGVLVVLLAIQAARLLWAVITPVDPLGPLPGWTPAAEVPALAGHDPFRTGDDGADPATPGLQDWRLFGLRSGSDGGAAILANGSGPQRAYRPGDMLAPGLVLERIEAGHALFRDGGASIRLELPAQHGLPRRAASPPSTLPATSATGTAAAAVDPSRLLAGSGLRHAGEGDGSAGYTVMPQADGALLRQAGLRPGDVLLRVNGQPLAPGTFAEVAAELQRNPRARIEFRRDGQDHSITLGSGNPP